MMELDLQSKRTSTEAHQAFLPVKILKREMFWNYNLTRGIHGVPRRLLLDADECGFAIQKTNRSSGHAPLEVRVRKIGNYCLDTKVTVLFCIEPGDP
mmetsp:Transcript_40274/g.121302  ORF Transcript_40274/g.121302 Transcript_40274/m.121302 type:complete len:97 (+) Transcript_40274:446-736(+)